MCMAIFVHVTICVYLCKRVCLYMYMCVCLHVCFYVCVRVCACLEVSMCACCVDRYEFRLWLLLFCKALEGLSVHVCIPVFRKIEL